MTDPETPAPRRPRYRYVLVESTHTPTPTRDELVRGLQSGPARPLGAWLTRYQDGLGMVRVPRENAPALRRLLERDATVGLRPLLTSGSIAGLQRKHRGARGLEQSRR